MHADVSCPKCHRKLRVPEGFAGQSVRCPACAATFEPQIAEVPEVHLGGDNPPLTQETISQQPRPAAPAPTPAPEPDPDQAEAAARSRRFVGGWPVVRRGLGWMMADKGIELAFLALDLLLFSLLVMDQLSNSGTKPPWLGDLYEWGPAGVCLRMLALFVAGICMLVGLSRCLRYPAPGPARGVVIAAIVFFSISYLFRSLCSPFRDPYLYLMYGWWDWFFRALLLVRWVAEGLLMLFLYYLGRDWRHEPTLARLRWLVALLVSDVALNLAYAVGLFEKVQAVLDHVLPNPFPGGWLVWPVLLIVNLATAAQLLRVLHAARGALAGPAGRDDRD